MLELKNITKTYRTGDTVVNALQNVSVNFRNNEFVAILGQSGSGKTTLLNIVGGLDRYDSGNMIINCRSTADYKDADWDIYRNHSVGFVFQSYNLIPHQTVLANVELALTLSGVSKAERRHRAKEVLEKVGLGDQLRKKPNQMSGGQMQRVAIARALVNNPDILLADEPTGALDSQTSLQIMELISEIAKDRLVIMVTHNPDLAEQYANRIISLKDGEILDDSNPYTDEECEAQAVRPEHRPKKKTKKNGAKTSMSFSTALSLSFNNLLTKKGRTLLTSFAGSIGIIGIALIMSLSNGMQAYIDSIEKDTLSSYPLTIDSESVDMGNMIDSISKPQKEETTHANDKIYKNDTFKSAAQTFNAKRTNNDLAHFKTFLESNEEVKNLTSDIKYGYDVPLQIYKSDTSEGVFRVNPSDIYDALGDIGEVGINTDVWNELIGDDDLLNKQYDILAGNWPKNKNEVVLFLDENNEISDYTLYQLGLSDLGDLTEAVMASSEKEETTKDSQDETTAPAKEYETYEYEEFMNISFKLILNTDIYKKNGKTWKDMTDDEAYMKNVVDNGLELKIVGIARATSQSKVKVSIGGTIGYKSELNNYVVSGINNSEIVKQQKKDTKTDVFTGLAFEPIEEEKDVKTEESTTAKQTATFEKPSIDFLGASSGNSAKVIDVANEPAQMTEDEIYDYIDKNYTGDDKDQVKSLVKIALKDVRTASERKQLIDYFDKILKESGRTDATGSQIYGYLQLMDKATKLQMISSLVAAAAEGDKVELPGEMPTGGSSSQEGTTKKNQSSKPEATTKPEGKKPEYAPTTYEDNLSILGVADLKVPSYINIYPKNFEAKEKIKKLIDDYNTEQTANGHEEFVIGYTDLVSLIMSSVTQIINLVTYALIAFVAISLIVSSIMIGVITYISVLERTKEIGILRSIGASKRDISHVFNSETIIIGLVSGVLGILLALLLLVPINGIIKIAADISGLAVMPVYGGLALVAISVLLTVIAGLIPSRVAAKKDPVIALRTE